MWSDLLREGDGDVGLRLAFDRWLASDPAHVQAFTRIDAAYRAALAVSGDRELVELENDTLQRLARRDRRPARRLMALAAAGVVAVVTLGVVYTGGSQAELRHLVDRARYALAGDTLYRTAVGERLAVTLEDGSTLTLNTGSRAVVRYADAQREVQLLDGQALFEVSRDTTRPFVVKAAGRRVVALGTAFDVRLSGDDFAVTLIEGRVAVEPDRAPAAARPAARGVPATELAAAAEPLPRLELTPGEQLVIAAQQPVVRRADVTRAISWREGQVIFEEDRLAHAIDEMNRYGGRRVVLSDARLGELRISGIFNTNDTAIFVETLTSYFPLQVVDTDRHQVVLGLRS